MSSPTVVREPARATGADVELLRIRDGVREDAHDLVAVEEPLEIHLNGWRWLVTMRTPGADADLVLGMLASEGVIARRRRGREHRLPPPSRRARPRERRRRAARAPARRAAARVWRATRRSPRRAAASAARAASRRILQHRPPVAPGPDRRRRRSSPRCRRGSPPRSPASRPPAGCTPPALFDAAGTLLAAREDVGRHNAVDKVHRLAAPRADAARRADPPGERPRQLRDRPEGAGGAIPIVAAVSAPSSLAVDARARRRHDARRLRARRRLQRLHRRERAADARRRRADRDPAPRGTIRSTSSRATSATRSTRSGRKISLTDWRALTRPERTRLDHARRPCRAATTSRAT